MKRTILLVFSLFVIISSFFFYPIFKGNIPFPGDLLVGEYTPYNAYPFFGFGPGAYPNKGQDFDVIRLIYPAKEFTIELLKKGELPLWNPYIFSGSPHLASLQSGTFYPINILFIISPFILAWTIYIVFQPILAGFFTYLLLKEYELSNFSSFFGGIVFSFSSFFTVWMLYGNLGHTFLWLPLVLFLIHKIIQKADAFKIMSLAAILTFSLLAGYIQTTMYLFAFTFAYGIFQILSGNNAQKIKKIFYLSLIFFLPLCFSAVQIMPTIELFRNSTRTPYSLESFLNLLIPLKHFVTILIPDFFGNPATRNYWLDGTYIERVSYIGVIPLFFAIYSISRRLSKVLLFYIFSLIIIFFLVFDTALTRFLYSIYMPPIFSTGVPTRIMFLFCFSLSVLSAFGFEEFNKSKSLKKFSLVSTSFLIILSILWGFVMFYPSQGEFTAQLLISKRNLILPSLILISGLFTLLLSFKLKKFKKILILGILILTIADLFYFFHKITPFSPSESLYYETPLLKKLRDIQGINRSWGYGSAYIEANVQTIEKIYGINGYDALHLKSYGELIASGKNGKLVDNPPRSEAVIEPGFGSLDLRNNIYRQNILDLIGVKYILHKTNLRNQDFETFPKEKYNLIWSDGIFQIYENLDILPRFFLTNQFIIEKNIKNRIEILTRKGASKSIILEESPGFESLDINDNGRVDLINYTHNKVLFNTNSKSDKLLYLSDVYDEGWQARIDGYYARIYKANHAFRAVFVPKGEHAVEFVYRPKSFDLGFKISIVSIAAGLVFVLSKLIKLNVKN